MRKNRNVAHYAGIISKETGIPRWKVHLTLMIAWWRICRAIYLGQEVRIKGFGRIYFTKNLVQDDGTHHPKQEPINDGIPIIDRNTARGMPWLND